MFRHQFPHSNLTDECLFILTLNTLKSLFLLNKLNPFHLLLYHHFCRTIGAIFCCTFSAYPKCIICTFFVFMVLCYSAHFDPQSYSPISITYLCYDIRKPSLFLQMSISSLEHYYGSSMRFIRNNHNGIKLSENDYLCNTFGAIFRCFTSYDPDAKTYSATTITYS